jgi:hypothetical protein
MLFSPAATATPSLPNEKDSIVYLPVLSAIALANEEALRDGGTTSLRTIRSAIGRIEAIAIAMKRGLVREG